MAKNQTFVSFNVLVFLNFWIVSTCYAVENEHTIVKWSFFWWINNNIVTFELNFHCFYAFSII